MKHIKLMFKSTTRSAGFSLIEILVALTLLGLAGTFVAGKIFQTLHEGQVKAARIQMHGLGKLLKDFKRHCGFYPTTDMGLEALVSEPTDGAKKCRRYQPGGYIEDGLVPLDPWENDFVYTSDGKTFDILSFGNDGAEGGEGEDADIPMKEKRGGGSDDDSGDEY